MGRFQRSALEAFEHEGDELLAHLLRRQFPGHVEIVDGGAAGLDLIPFIEGRESVLMVDAVNFDREPGYISILENEEIPVRLTQKASMHHLGLMDVLCIVRMSGNMPKELRHRHSAQKPRTRP